jgi:hypothetical protein
MPLAALTAGDSAKATAMHAANSISEHSRAHLSHCCFLPRWPAHASALANTIWPSARGGSPRAFLVLRPMTKASALLDAARRHLCDVDEIVDRLAAPHGVAASETGAESLHALGQRHLDAVHEIVRHLAQIGADAELKQLANELKETSTRLLRASEM